jgi:alcohol dehydrogenase (cytochrome c)
MNRSRRGPVDRWRDPPWHATPFVQATWGEIHPQTGAVTVRRVPTAEGTEICPGPAGGKEWNHTSYSRKTGLVYAPVIKMCATFHVEKAEFRESLPNWGGQAKPSRVRKQGFVNALDPLTGKEVWAWRTEYPVVSSLLTTAGGVAFVGRATGEFTALDARNGWRLWEFQTGSGIHGSPVTYSIAGKQYVAVPSGWGGWVQGFAPELYGAPRGNALFVFTLS